MAEETPWTVTQADREARELLAWYNRLPCPSLREVERLERLIEEARVPPPAFQGDVM